MAEEFYIENRGSREVPFGFIYRGEEARAAYSVIDGVVTIGGSGSGYWGSLTMVQKRRALKQLAERYELSLALTEEV